MLNFLPIILFFYAHGSVYYSTIPAYYSNLFFHYAHEESMIKAILIVLNHNRGLYLVSKMVPIRKKIDKTDKKFIGHSSQWLK